MLGGGSYLVSPSATAKAQPVTPFPLRKIYAVFLHVAAASTRWRATLGNDAPLLLHVPPGEEEERSLQRFRIRRNPYRSPSTMHSRSRKLARAIAR